MADNDVVVGEVEADPIETPTNPIVDFMKSVEGGEFTSAEQQFNDMIGDRLQDALDAAKVKIATSLYGDIDDTLEVEVEDELDTFEDDLEADDEVELTDDEQDVDDEDVAPV